MRKKILTAAVRLARKKLSRKKYAKQYKSLNPYNIKAKTDTQLILIP